MDTTPFPNPFSAQPVEKKPFVDPKELRDLFRLQLECQECHYMFTEKDPFPHQCPICHPVLSTRPEERIVSALCDKICYLIMVWWREFTIRNPFPLVEDLKPEHLDEIVKHLERNGINQVHLEVAKVDIDPKSGKEVMCLHGFFTDSLGSKIQIGETNLVFYSWFNKVMRWLAPMLTNFSNDEKERLHVVIEETSPPKLSICLGDNFIAVHEVPSHLPVKDVNRVLAILSETSQHGYTNL